MLTGMIDAVKGCMKEEIRMDIIANNMANSNVVGFKKSRISFRDVLGAAEGDQTSSGAESGDLLAVKMDLSQGDVRGTGNPLDFCINGKGFFKVETDQGIRFTRKGNFTMDFSGFLTTQNGDRVMGKSGPIKLTDGQIHVDGEGNVLVDGQEVGQMEIVDFENCDGLVLDGKCLFKNQTEEPERPQSADAKVMQGYVEISNVNVAEEMVQMIHSLRAFESYQKAIQVLDGLDNRVINDVSKVR